MTKYLYAWASQTKQVVIANKPYIDKSEQKAKLLSKWPLKTVISLKTKAFTGEPRCKSRSKKQIIIEKTSREILGKIEEIIILIAESGSKIYKPILYNIAVNNPFHKQRWQKAIEDKLQNLENHQTWKYDELFLGRKAIGLK